MSESTIVAVVTGASRGVGRGIAIALGGKGATVYVVGRTQSDDTPRATGEAVLPGTIYDAAAAVTAAGGHGIAVTCDMTDSAQIIALFKQVERESGRLDILVNNAAFVHNDMLMATPFWEKSLAVGNILDVGLRCHYTASHQAAPMMVRQKQGLIVNISFFGAVSKFHDPAYGASKAGLDKMAFDMADELRPHNVAAISLWPGIVATERVQQMAEHIAEVKDQMDTFETPQFSGLVIDALYRDPDLLSLSGKTLIGAELAKHYGIRDIDGKQPDSLRNSMGNPHPAFS
ncbi:SDR family NAD(P)-dependent oxidoreductase [Pseudomonas brassicacearum]|jgi:NAD(P)-dependent dehydrogenase (short-subunit alcohol dehydrogenase family)|uniref:Short-chain dehydrogenase n=1 Tax=Pseudomonas brassicacearum TaxID=930166 RepID=A0A423JJP0_9PSED|nr:SDR family NAD(P)-dependent oxidoreductase [Pseudomonas brassicacearum]RON37926.1 short-chain dehydrogenase [Pseudomonas brassicacearum]